ncbi:uncharacterized protein Bfra_007111 [Botrytis fragariae]|uniref:Uncharacterized protein n=1 Tax=Botrytis fragariae TaxID=1964551 RepID=A0A8H6ED70_9HELO|nr:uncharacterized protein Bfra_007111 [Botrytis fragariae]KAF5867916.1 hypothetical protein Bfra_007111 [Botrytis fragariae]
MDNGAGIKTIGNNEDSQEQDCIQKISAFNSLKRLTTVITHKNPNGQSRTLIFLEMPRSLARLRLFYHQKASRRTCMQVFMQLTPYGMLTFSAPKQKFPREAEAQFVKP